MKPAVIIAALLASAGPVLAADLVVSVKTPAGAPVPNAVVTLHAPGAPAAATRVGWPTEMIQRDLAFDPFVLVVPVGAQVSFPNQDKVRHHVYSFSATKRFELKLFGRGETRSVTFDKAGAAAVGCNIHDGMVGFIKVVDTPFAAKTDAKGEAVIRNAPAGAATYRVWHPYLKTPANELARQVTLPRDGRVAQTVAADVRIPRHVHHAY